MKKSNKSKNGVMVMKDGLAWGVTYQDGRETNYGWMSPEEAELSDPKRVKVPTDLMPHSTQYHEELLTGTVVNVKYTRTITVEIV
jgi:hypothetical protein